MAAQQPIESAAAPNQAMFEAKASLSAFRERLLPLLDATEASMAQVLGSHFLSNVPLLKKLSESFGGMIVEHAGELAEEFVDEVCTSQDLSPQLSSGCCGLGDRRDSPSAESV